MRLWRRLAGNHGPQGVDADTGNTERSRRAVAFYQGNNGVLIVVSSRELRPNLPAGESLVSIDDFPFAAERRKAVAPLHDLADTVRQEPCGFHAASERPLKLTHAETLLAGRQQVDRLQPQAKRQMAILENRVDPHGKGLPADVALAEARTARCTSQTPDLVTRSAAVRAYRTIRPQLRLDVGESGVFVVEMGGGQNKRCHSGFFSMAFNLSPARGDVKCNDA